MKKVVQNQLAFRPDSQVNPTKRGGLFRLSRFVEGQERSVVLTPFEALLCSVLERGADPAEVLGVTRAEYDGVHERIARLHTALRAFLLPSDRISEMPLAHTVFDTPMSYFEKRGTRDVSVDLLRRDIAPQELVWYVTHRCPRRCRYCHWVDKGRSDLEPDFLPLSEAKGLVREAWLAGVKRLVLTGGEPMLRRDLMAIISSGARLGLPIWLFTRFHFTPERAKQLKASGVAHVYYSLDTLDGATNNDMVENSSVAPEARRSLVALEGAGVDVTVVPVLTALNTNCLPELASNLASIGVKAIRPIAYKGRVGSDYNELFQLSEQDKSNIRSDLEVVERIITLDRTTLDLDQKAGICESGITTVYIQPNGGVSYCPLTRGSAGAPIGYLPKDNLNDIWHNQRLASLLAGNALPLAGPRHMARTTPVSSCVLRKERLDLK